MPGHDHGQLTVKSSGPGWACGTLQGANLIDIAIWGSSGTVITVHSEGVMHHGCVTSVAAGDTLARWLHVVFGDWSIDENRFLVSHAKLHPGCTYPTVISNETYSNDGFVDRWDMCNVYRILRAIDCRTVCQLYTRGQNNRDL